jgi:hypothetical protein
MTEIKQVFSYTTLSVHGETLLSSLKETLIS